MKEQGKRVRFGEGDVAMETEFGMMQLLEGGQVPRDAGSLQKLEKARKRFSFRAARKNAILPTQCGLSTSRNIINLC